MGCMAADIIIVNKVNNNYNLSGLLTRSLPGWKCVQLISWIMYSEDTKIPEKKVKPILCIYL